MQESSNSKNFLERYQSNQKNRIYNDEWVWREPPSNKSKGLENYAEWEFRVAIEPTAVNLLDADMSLNCVVFTRMWGGPV